MEAKELRIGNYGKEITHSTNRVVRVKKHHFEDIVRGEIDLFPIPLTEKWLVKFGFVGTQENVFWLGEFFKYTDNTLIIFGEDSQIDRQCYHAKCEFVHQIQNLYFALTNKELKLK